jgi:hypothetical protein
MYQIGNISTQKRIGLSILNTELQLQAYTLSGTYSKAKNPQRSLDLYLGNLLSVMVLM